MAQAVRSVAELRDVDDPAWPYVAQLATEAGATVLPADRGGETLHRLQVTARSTLGALALNCGGILVDHGWLRILGGGHGGLPDLADATGLPQLPSPENEPTGLLVVAYDVLGGVFAIDGGGLGVKPGDVCYFAPDTLDWLSLEGGHSAFVHWSLTTDLTDFFGGLRWPGWESEVEALGLDEGLSVWPPPWSAEGKDLGAASRKAVPFDEILALEFS